MEKIPKILLETLEDLPEYDLKKFKFHLNQKMEGFSPIPRGELESADRIDITNKLIEVYLPVDSVKITLCILKQMKKKALAEKMEIEMQNIYLPVEDLDEPEKKKRRLSADQATLQHCVEKNSSKSVDQGKKASARVEDPLQGVKKKHKQRLREDWKYLHDVNDRKKTHVNQIYTKVQIIEGERNEVNQEHEVHQLEKASRTSNPPDSFIDCNDIFSSVAIEDGEDEEEQKIRTVLMKGIAGIGKTVSVQKFIMDWVDGKANTDIDFVFVLPLRELNLLNNKDCLHDLHDLLVQFNPELDCLGTEVYDDCKVLFVFDGLDESRFSLDFKSIPKVHNAKIKSTVDVMVVNLIRKNLLPSACIWITSRPAAANQIPFTYINRFIEVQGFNDQQKEEYFSKKIRDQKAASKIISHIKTTRSLHIMCHIPIFCWISAQVLEKFLIQDQNQDIPKTLTEMYLHFLLIQTTVKNNKYDGKPELDSKRLLESNHHMILNLAELAYRQLMKGNVMFYEEDLMECGVESCNASIYSGLCSELLKAESVFYKRSAFCFVHLSIQEFLAALFVFHCFITKNLHDLNTPLNGLQKNAPLHELLKIAVNEALSSKNGHLDLFLRFLFGISLDSNQKHLQGLVTCTGSNSESIRKIILYIQRKIKSFSHIFMFRKKTVLLKKEDPSPERCINLFLCLLEMNDVSLYKEIEDYLKSDQCTEEVLSAAHCSVIAYMVQIYEDVLDELDLQKFNTNHNGRRRLVPAVRNCKRAKLAGSGLRTSCCESVAEALRTENSPLRELDLSDNYQIDEGMKQIYGALSNCPLEILRLVRCHLTEQSCKGLASALRFLSPHLKELDLSNNDLRDSGLKLLFDGVNYKQLVRLRLNQCNLSEGSCETLASLLSSDSSHLRELDLSNNALQSAGVFVISAELKSPHCSLETLKLSGCSVTHYGSFCLSVALRLNPLSVLRELDLSYNHLEDSGEKLLSELLLHQQCTLEKLILGGSSVSRMKAGMMKYACELLLNPNTADPGLRVSKNKKKATFSNRDLYHDHSFAFVRCREGLHGRCYWEVEVDLSGSHAAVMAVGCKEMKKGFREVCWFIVNNMSWSIQWGSNSFIERLTRKRISCPTSSSNRIGVFLDLPNEILSFYTVQPDTHTPTHVFSLKAAFKEPAYVGFYISPGAKVTLCDL